MQICNILTLYYFVASLFAIHHPCQQGQCIRRLLVKNWHGVPTLMSGVPESRSIVHDKSKIDKILSYAVGRNVPVVDAFRLGKLKHYAEQPEGNASDVRPRPILVKLGYACNRRVVLLAERKLQEFESGMQVLCAS